MEGIWIETPESRLTSWWMENAIGYKGICVENYLWVMRGSTVQLEGFADQCQLKKKEQRWMPVKRTVVILANNEWRRIRDDRPT